MSNLGYSRAAERAKKESINGRKLLQLGEADYSAKLGLGKEEVRVHRNDLPSGQGPAAACGGIAEWMRPCISALATCQCLRGAIGRQVQRVHAELRATPGGGGGGGSCSASGSCAARTNEYAGGVAKRGCDPTLGSETNEAKSCQSAGHISYHNV